MVNSTSGYKNWSLNKISYASKPKSKALKRWNRIKRKNNQRFKKNKTLNVVKGYARRMRQNPTPAEAVLFECLKSLALNVESQRSIGNRILDFYLPSIKIAVEADGLQHYSPEGIAADRQREEQIKRLIPGIRFVRLSNYFILNTPNLREEVLKKIASCSVKCPTRVIDNTPLTPYNP